MSESSEIYFLDTNIFMRVLVRADDQSFKECSRLLNKVKQGDIQTVTSSLVLAEVSFVLKSFYKFSKPEIIEALESILSLKNLVIQDGYDSRIALTLFEKHNVKFVDTLLAAHTLVADGRAIMVSYDREFSRLPCRWVVPSKVR